jgi:alkylhydroperoxidase family enzyme
MVQQVDAAAAAVNSDDGIRHAGTTAAEVGAGATDCVGCRPGSHKAHTCGKARPRGGCKRPALQALTRNLDFDHPGQRMRCNSCNMCLDKDQQLAQKDEIIAELKRERNEAQRLVALYEEDYEGGDYEDYENEEHENEEYEGEDQVAIVRQGALWPLIALVSEGSAGAQEKAAKALRNLAVNDENEMAIVHAGALVPLIALLSEGSAILL